MIIQPYQYSDEAELIQLWKVCDLVVPWNNPTKDIARKCAKDRDLFLVGRVDNQLVASIMGGYEGHRGWMNYLAVLPEHQNHGYAQQLVARLEQTLTDIGCPKINLQVRGSNTSVIGFYVALGYQLDDCVSLGKRLEMDGPKE